MSHSKLKIRTLATLLVLLTDFASGEAPQQLIINANLLSPERPSILADAWVRIEDGRIAEVGAGPVETTGFNVIDAADGFLIPGLIDSHVHLYHATGLKRQYSNNYESLYESYMRQQPRSFLYYGFTSVVELNADAATNQRFVASPLRPRLFHCGQGVILANGFMALELEEASLEDAYPGYLIDHYAGNFAPVGADRSRHTAEAVVDHVRQQGGRCIKLYFEEALWWPGGAPEFSLPSIDIVQDVVAAAHAHDMPVLLHATTPAGHRFALETGIDILVHGMWEWPNQAFDAPTPTPAFAKVASDVAASGTAVQPTFSTIRNTASLFDTDLLDDPEWSHALPRSYLQYLRTNAQQQRSAFLNRFAATLFASSISADTLPRLMSVFASRYRNLIGAMDADDARLLFGTDTAVGGFGWASPPGLAGYWEMLQWTQSDIPLATLFKALTIRNAQAFGLDTEIGTIENGKRADMLILAKNPLLSVTAYNSIKTVIIDGKAIDRASLSAKEQIP